MHCEAAITCQKGFEKVNHLRRTKAVGPALLTFLQLAHCCISGSFFFAGCGLCHVRIICNSVFKCRLVAIYPRDSSIRSHPASRGCRCRLLFSSYQGFSTSGILPQQHEQCSKGMGESRRVRARRGRHKIRAGLYFWEHSPHPKQAVRTYSGCSVDHDLRIS